jgi:hypothetical protein
MTRRKKVKIAERAVIGRINRRLRDNDMKLLTARGGRMKLDVGFWYVINTRNGFVVQPYKHMDLADIAREVGALKDCRYRGQLRRPATAFPTPAFICRAISIAIGPGMPIREMVSALLAGPSMWVARAAAMGPGICNSLEEFVLMPQSPARSCGSKGFRNPISSSHFGGR